ncbi:hypothetical protein HPB52_002137 [Rhipicephalus sanguineus]|uniref:Uncharacterized protein n=1 Tax=Rhipicephalus sanguineus TaxID=34632 RepID=A0A9D4PPP7_RHISA|nr:hypothetical protein HPB52_002137 [Rhipicephalus sanguineus]
MGKRRKKKKRSKTGRGRRVEQSGVRITGVARLRVGFQTRREKSDKAMTLQLPTVYSEVCGLKEFRP